MGSTPTAMRRLRRLGFTVFYRLPSSVRRRLVRLAVGKYIVGAVALVQDENDRLLLLRQPPGVGWGLPAGLLQRGETPAQGCLRELQEESGIAATEENLAPAVPNAVVHHRGRWVDMVFRVRVRSDEVTLQVDGAEVLEARWYPLGSLPPLTSPTAVLLSYYGIGPYVEYPEVRR
jgi:ADP-ribose pyrophosphatase YjhB (NUDIX family)